MRLQRRCNEHAEDQSDGYEAILKIKFVDQLWRSIEGNSCNFGYLIQRKFQNYYLSLHSISLRIDLQS